MQSRLDDFFKCKKVNKFPNKCLRDADHTLIVLRYQNEVKWYMSMNQKSMM